MFRSISTLADPNLNPNHNPNPNPNLNPNLNPKPNLNPNSKPNLSPNPKPLILKNGKMLKKHTHTKKKNIKKKKTLVTIVFDGRL